MALRPRHSAASLFVTLLFVVPSTTGVDYVTAPDDLQGVANDQWPFDKNGNLVPIPIASCAIVDFADLWARGAGTTQLNFKNGEISGWTFFSKFAPTLLVTLNTPAVLVAVAYRCSPTSCVKHVWNISFNGDTSVIQVSASNRSNWYVIGLVNLNRLVANFTLQLNTDDDSMAACFPQRANIKLSLSSFFVFTTKLNGSLIDAVTFGHSSPHNHHSRTMLISELSTRASRIWTAHSSRFPYSGHVNFTHRQTRTHFVTRDASDLLSTSRMTDRITYRNYTSGRKTSWTSQYSGSAKSSSFVTLSPTLSNRSEDASSRTVGLSAVPTTAANSTTSFPVSDTEQIHSHPSTAATRIHSMPTRLSEDTSKSTAETVTASASPTDGDQSNNSSPYSTRADSGTNIAVTNSATTSDESTTDAADTSSSLTPSTLTPPGSLSTASGSHLTSDGARSPQPYSTEDTIHVNTTETEHLASSTRSIAAVATSVSDEKRTTARTPMPLTSSVQTSVHTMPSDVVYKCNFRITSMKFVSSMSDHESSAYSVVYTIVYPLLNSSFAISFGSTFVKILAVSFSSGSVVVQNWVVLNSMATADQINQTQSTLFDAFQQNGYETDDFIMVIDPSYANELNFAQTTVNVLVIALVAGIVVVVIVVVVSLSVIACRRHGTSRGGHPTRWRPRDPRDMDLYGAVTPSGYCYDTSNASQSLSSTLSASLDGFSLPRYGLRLPRVQLVNSMWQTIPTVSAFHQESDPVRQGPSGDPFDDDAIYRQIEATRNRLTCVQPSADESDSGNQTMRSTDEPSVDEHGPEQAWIRCSRNAFDCDYFGSPVPRTNDVRPLHRGRSSPTTRRWEDGNVATQTTDGGGGGDADNTRQANGVRRLLRRLPTATKHKGPAEKEIPDVDFGGLFIPTFQPVLESGLSRQLAERASENAARGAIATHAFPVATGDDPTGNSHSSCALRPTPSAAAAAATNLKATPTNGDRPADDALAQPNSSDAAVACVTWFPTSARATDDRRSLSVSEFVQDGLPTLFAPVNDSPRRKNKQKNDLLHRS